MSEQMRKQFETYMVKQNVCTSLARHRSDDSYRTISVQRAWELWQAALAELTVTDALLEERQKVLDAIPPCPAHGPCVPHALEWIEAQKAALATQPQAPQGAVTGWLLPLSAVNDLQEKSIDALIDKAKRARWVNAVTRKDAVENTFEADWIKHMVKVAAAPETPEVQK